MKKHKNYFILILFVIFGFSIFNSCEFLQGGLGSELRKKLNEETGIISINSTVWYYPGAADMDMSLSPKSELALNISKKAAVVRPDDPSKPNGLTGAFKVNYTNAAGKQSLAVLPFKGGRFNEDYSVFYLDASPVAAVLNPELNPGGKGILELTIAGFVNNEDSDQKGRPLPPFTGTIDIEPLFPNRNIYFSSRTPVRGRSIEIPLNAPVEFSSTADFIINGGNNYPKGLFDADFSLELSPDKRRILLTPRQELLNLEFDFEVNIMGIIPPLSGLAAECSFNVFVTNSLVILDGIKDEVWNAPETIYASDPAGDSYSGGYIQPGNDITGLYVLSDLRNLYVAFEFASLSNMWENDRIGILIEKTSNLSGDTTESLATVTSAPKLSSSMTITGGTAFIYFVHLPGSSRGTGNSVLRRARDTIETDLSGKPNRVASSQYGWSNPNGPLFLEYRFALNDLGLAAGDQIRVLGVLSNHWDSDDSIHCTDIVPGGPGSPQADTRNAVYDFNTGLHVTLGEGPAYVPPNPADVIPPSAPVYLAASAVGSNGARFRWGAQFNADSYRLFRCETPDGVYTDLGTEWTGTGGTDWNVTAGQTYYYKVCGVNLAGLGQFTSSVQVTMSGSEISKYSIIDMSAGLGVLEDGFRDPQYAAFSVNSLPAGGSGNFDIKGLYVTNDIDNVYVALDFGSSPPAAYENSRIFIALDNPGAAGSAVLNSGNWPADQGTTVNPVNANGINQYISKRLGASSLTLSPSGPVSNAPAAWFKDENREWYCFPPNEIKVIKFQIPRSNLGNPAEGDKIYVFASFSEGWDSDELMIRDLVPVSAAPGAADGARSITINITNALEHTIF